MVIYDMYDTAKNKAQALGMHNTSTCFLIMTEGPIQSYDYYHLIGCYCYKSFT